MCPINVYTSASREICGVPICARKTVCDFKNPEGCYTYRMWCLEEEKKKKVPYVEVPRNAILHNGHWIY